MKIDPNSASGKHLLGQPHGAHVPHSWGADLEDLQRAYFFPFNLQLGGAITLPVPFIGAVVLIKRRFLEFDGNVLKDAPSLWLIRHELCHVAQIRRWGSLRYMLKHTWGRITSFSLMARICPVEGDCYEIHQHFAEETFHEL